MHNNLILKHLNLLLVDDNRNIHAETAMTAFDDKNIDLIITDIEMPDVDGLTFVENIRSFNTTVPIIILSAHSDKEYLLRAANLQIDGYIIKPLSFKKLEPALTRAVKRLEYRVNIITISKKITYHPLLKMLVVDNKEVSLGSKECLLLELLLHEMHRVVSKKRSLKPSGQMT